MLYLDSFILVLIGSGDIEHSLKNKVKELGLSKSVHFLGKLPPEQLYKLTPLADLGISLEEDLGLNYRFSLPNKIFDYVQAEVPVLISDLPEMKKIVAKHQIGEIVLDRAPKQLAHQIEKIVNKDFSEYLIKAKQKLVWKNEEQKLLTLFKSLS